MSQLIETKYYSYTNDELSEKTEIDNEHLYKVVTEFDKCNKPKLISFEMFDVESSKYNTLYVDRYMYDDKDNLVTIDRVWATGKTSDIKNMKYDKKDRVVEITDIESGFYTKYSYSNVKDISLNRDGVYQITTKKTYKLSQDKKPKLIRTQYDYLDELGQIRLVHIEDHIAKKNSAIKYTYNNINRTITIYNDISDTVRVEKLDDNGMICWSVDIIHNDKCRVESIEYHDCESKYMKKCTVSINNNLSIEEDYDKFGNIISCKVYGTDKELNSYVTYENKYVDDKLVEIKKYENLNLKVI